VRPYATNGCNAADRRRGILIQRQRIVEASFCWRFSLCVDPAQGQKSTGAFQVIRCFPTHLAIKSPSACKFIGVGALGMSRAGVRFGTGSSDADCSAGVCSNSVERAARPRARALRAATPALAKPGGPAITLPGSVAPPGADKITLVLRGVRSSVAPSIAPRMELFSIALSKNLIGSDHAIAKSA